jgi:hypothetical protein
VVGAGDGTDGDGEEAGGGDGTDRDAFFNPRRLRPLPPMPPPRRLESPSAGGGSMARHDLGRRRWGGGEGGATVP